MIGMGKKAGDAKDVVANVERGFVDRVDMNFVHTVFQNGRR